MSVQGKVSMVMPCYNKVDYIGEMFDSIIAQEWDNIELILVNDGSTDGTREVIAEYEPKFINRGFEVLIIDQENAGVCAAAKAGLERITGDYVCMVDADDELDPKYVSTMAGWLEEHDEYDIAACEGIHYSGRGDNKLFSQFSRFEYQGISDDQYRIEKYLLSVIRPTVWIYMVRTQYFIKCGITDSYFTETKGSHEPGYIIPLLANDGQLKYFRMPLYRFNLLDVSHSRSRLFEHAQVFYDNYDFLCKKAIDQLPESILDKEKKKRLKNISMISKYICLYLKSIVASDGYYYTDDMLKKIIDTLYTFGYMKNRINRETLVGFESIFIDTIKKLFTMKEPIGLNIIANRIIGYGVLGKQARILLPYLENSRLQPTELWDIAGDGNIVKKPDFESLNENDLVYVFPVGEIEGSLQQQFAELPNETIFNNELREIIVSELF